MSTKENKALMRRFFEEWNKGKAAIMADVDKGCANDIVAHSSTGREMRGLKDFKQFLSGIWDAFPDIHYTLDDLFIEGDKAVLRYSWTGTHKGSLMGIPPTNKKVTMWAIEIYRFVNGKLVEAWGRIDTFGLTQQLGAIPTPRKEK